jgi:hypothetical protein
MTFIGRVSNVFATSKTDQFATSVPRVHAGWVITAYGESVWIINNMRIGENIKQLLLTMVSYRDSNTQPTDRNLNLKGKRERTNDRVIDCAYWGRLPV